MAVKIDFSDMSSMESLLKVNNRIETDIDTRIQNYQENNLSVAMKNLENVGKILKLAYAGSKGFPCSRDVYTILSDYQTMIKNFYVTSSSFVSSSLIALNNHKAAVMFAEKDLMDNSLKWITKCSSVASEMAADSEKMLKEVTALVDLSVKALKTTNSDESISNTEKKKVTDMINEEQANQAKFIKTIEILHKQIEDYKKQEADIVKTLDKEKSRTFTLKALKLIPAIISLNISSVKDNLSGTDAGSSDLEKREKAIIAIRQDLENQNRTVNSKIAGIIESLKGLKNIKNDLTVSIKALGLTVTALGKIKTIFEHSKQFWIGVSDQCKALKDTELLEIMVQGTKDSYIDAVEDSALSWLALGKINYISSATMKVVDKQTDDILIHLPNQSAALAMILNEADSIIKSLQNEQPVS